MATITIPDTSGTPGLVSQGADTISAVDIALITGSEPAYLQTDEQVKLSQTIPLYCPVMYDGSTDTIIPAVQGTPAIGIALIDIVSPGSGALKAIPILRAACLNPAKIAWPGSYDTPLKKRNAFKGAPTPTNIVVREVKAATVI